MPSKKKKVVLSVSAFLVISVLAVGFNAWKQYTDSLDLPIAYSDYISYGWSVPFNYLKNIDSHSIPQLEDQFDGIITHVVQAYSSEGYGTLTKDQEEENVRIIKLALLFLEKGANINYTHPTKSYNTALNYAILKASPSLVKFLLDHGADPSVRDRMGGHEKTALERAHQYISRKMTSNPRTQEKLKEIIGILER